MSYKILSLDGGGSWAMIQARVLKDIYPGKNGLEILREFDMVIANSGGSMVLAAMISGMSMDDIISVFCSEKERKLIFSKLSFWDNPGMAIMRKLGFGFKYKAEDKLEGLKKVLMQYTNQPADKLVASQPMSQLTSILGSPFPKVIICGFNYYTERASFFRSDPYSKADSFDGKIYDVSLLHAIHASSNAPLNYFDEAAIIKTGILGSKLNTRAWYWDGAVGGFNNPVMAGLVEALTNTPNRTADDFSILSLGTGACRKPVIIGYNEDKDDKDKLRIFEKNKNNPLVIAEQKSGFFYDLPKMAHSILADPPDAASFVAYSVLKPDLENSSCIVRINPVVSPVLTEDHRYVVPSAWKDSDQNFLNLLNLDMDAVEENEVALIEKLCDRFIVQEGQDHMPNQFIRGDDRYPRHIGYGSYSLARQEWLKRIGREQ